MLSEREIRFRFLSIFGDGQQHPWVEVIQLGQYYVDPKNVVSHRVVTRHLKRALEDGLISRLDNDRTKLERLNGFYVLEPREFDYKITEKGDACIRAEQIARGGDYRYYKYYDRSVHGSWGADKFAKVPGQKIL